jgi:hypothetical protein
MVEQNEPGATRRRAITVPSYSANVVPLLLFSYTPNAVGTGCRMPVNASVKRPQSSSPRRPRALVAFIAEVALATIAAVTTGCATGGAESDADSSENVPDPSDETNVDGTAAASGDCTFDVDYELSPKISTVGIVTWSTNFEPTSARIEFGLSESHLGLTAPVDLEAPQWRTLLLGMKAARTYEFRIVAANDDAECVSPAFELTTGAVPNSVPPIESQAFGTTPSERGFVITSAGVGNGGIGGAAEEESTPMFIFDNDGDIVWYWEETPPGTGRALMDWEGQNMWMIAVNVTGGGGRVARVSMDGLDFDANVAGLREGHHDLAALPGGVMTAIAYMDDCSGLIERSPDGKRKVIVRDVSTLYQPGGSVFGAERECHPNSVLYHPEDDTYTLSDRNSNTFVKFTRDGTLLWQLGGSNPLGNHFEGTWSVNHGHHVLENGNFLFFSNGTGAASTVFEYRLDEATWQATKVWEYNNGLGSFALGDVQRLPGGNTLITYSNAGVLFEVTPEGESVKEFVTDSLGYAMHRKSLYGPPPK